MQCLPDTTFSFALPCDNLAPGQVYNSGCFHVDKAVTCSCGIPLLLPTRSTAWRGGTGGHYVARIKRGLSHPNHCQRMQCCGVSPTPTRQLLRWLPTTLKDGSWMIACWKVCTVQKRLGGTQTYVIGCFCVLYLLCVTPWLYALEIVIFLLYWDFTD